METEFKNKAGTVTYQNDDELKILLIYREDHDDWTLPKGHIEQGEKLTETAARETEEETGYTVETTDKVDSKIYRYRYEDTLYTCEVHYFLAEPEEFNEEIVPNEEVDEIAWVEFEQVKDKLSYESDQKIIEQAEEKI